METSESKKLFQMIEEIEQKSSLTQQEKDRMEKNRLRAIAIKNTKADNKRNATSSFFSGAKVLCLRLIKI